MIAIFTRRRLLSATVMVVMMLAVILTVGYIAAQNGKFPIFTVTNLAMNG